MANVSLKPSTFTEPTFWDDAEIELVSARFGLYQFVTAAGENKGEQNGLIIEHKVKDADETRKDFYSYGDREGDFFRPAKDGKALECIGTRQALNASSNAAVFLASLVSAGFDESLLADDISVLDGTVIIGGTTSLGVNTEGKPRLVRTAARIMTMPGGKAKATGKRGAAKVKAAAGADIAAKATDVIIGILAEAENNTLPKIKLLAALSKAMPKDDPDRTALIQVATNDEFLSGSESWAYESGMLTL